VIGVLDKLNFAHPEVFMFGGIVGFVCAAHTSVWWAFPLAFMVGGLMGLVTEFVSFRRFQSDDAKTTAALSSLSLGLVLVDITHKVWGSEPVDLGLTSGIFKEGFTVAGVRFLWIQLIILAVTFALMLALHLAVSRTSAGRRIRAVAESSTNAALLGIDVRKVTQTVFFVSSALAAVAGLLLALRTGVANPELGLTFGLKAVAIMAIGGMGDLRGAVIAGLLIGVLEALTFQFGLGRLGEMTVWVAMLIVLLWRRGGLFRGMHAGEQRV
jgi:branched-chain amino acid transport system permease protein